VLVEILLKFLVGVIDVELFKPVDLMRDEEAGKSSNSRHVNEGKSWYEFKYLNCRSKGFLASKKVSLKAQRRRNSDLN